jgi:hypothetical protein
MTVQYQDTSVLNLTANEDLAKYRRVKLTGDNLVVYADVEDAQGVTRSAVVSGAPVGVAMLNKPGTHIMVAAGAISQNALVYPAADGKVTASVTGRAIGRWISAAATADGDQGEVLAILTDMFSGDLAGVINVQDDFTQMLLTGAERLWTGTQTDTGTITILDAVGGVLQLEASDGSIGDNDESYAGTTNETFLFAAGKPLYFEARVALKVADSDNANVMVGLVSAANAANTILDTGGGPLATYSGAVFFKKDGGTAWEAEVSVGSTQINPTLTAPGAPGVTYQKLGIEFLPTSATLATVNFYVDGVLVGTTAAFTFTSATEMSLFVGVKNGGTTVNTTLYVDYVRCSQVR